MTLTAAVGVAQALDGREAGSQAAQAALDQLGRAPVGLGLVIASSDYPIQQVVNGVSALLGDTPLFGFSSSGEFTSKGSHHRAVVVGILAGSELKAKAEWLSPSASLSESRAMLSKAAEMLQVNEAVGTVLLAADGAGPDPALRSGDFLDILFNKSKGGPNHHGNLSVAGCLASGDLRSGKTYQIGGKQAGFGGLAVAVLERPVVSGIGFGHGWKPSGIYFQVTQARGLWVRGLDDKRPADTFAQLFQNDPHEWGLPPLNELIRLYPLGVERDPQQLEVHAPLRMESDGSLRMNTAVAEGSTGHIMVGSPSNCKAAAEEAARQALDNLRQENGAVKPALALVMVDAAWQMLFQAQPGEELQAVQSVLGPEVPVMGGYILGQIAVKPPEASPEVLNQQIEVVIFGSS